MQYHYQVANHLFTIDTLDPNLQQVLFNYAPFELTKSPLLNDDRKFTFKMSCEVSKKGNFIYSFQTENMFYYLYRTENECYVIEFLDMDKNESYLLEANADWSFIQTNLGLNNTSNYFVLNNMLMFSYVFCLIPYNTIVMHASTIKKENKAFLFLGKSGTGKSTHTGLWLKHIEGSSLLNDDNPIVRIENDEVFVYGSPWSGKTHCYLNEKVPLGGVFRLKQSPVNELTKLHSSLAFASVLPSCSVMKWEYERYSQVCKMVSIMVEKVPVFLLNCLPNEAAAQLAAHSVFN